MTETVKKNNGFIIISGIALALSLILGIFSVIFATSPAAGCVNSINLGNRFLSDMDYESAIASYRAALEIDERNEDALKGLMQAAYSTNDLDLLNEALDAYERSGISDPYMDEMSEKMTELLVNAKLEEAAQLVDDGKYEEALKIIDELSDGSEADISALQVQLYEKCAENAWKERRFEDAVDYLKKALEITDDENIKKHLLNVVEGYVNDCINHQEYEKAYELVTWMQEIGGSSALSGYESRIADMESFDGSFQSQIEDLNAAFEINDVKLIEELMNREEFKDAGKNIRTVFYSNSLKGGDRPEGTGTAIYVDGGTLYVYYGDFSNGLRNGHGLYYYSSDNSHLTKYSLEWADDIPQGEGTCELYDTMTSWKNGVKVSEREQINELEFTLHNGYYDGVLYQHSTVFGNNGYSYELYCDYVDGIPEKIFPGEYPELIGEALGNPNAILASWTQITRYDDWGDSYTTTIWNEWSAYKDGVPGISSHPTYVSPKDITITPLG